MTFTFFWFLLLEFQLHSNSVSIYKFHMNIKLSKLVYGKRPTLKFHTLPFNFAIWFMTPWITLKSADNLTIYKFCLDLETFQFLLVKINHTPPLTHCIVLCCHIAICMHVHVSITSQRPKALRDRDGVIHFQILSSKHKAQYQTFSASNESRRVKVMSPQ